MSSQDAPQIQTGTLEHLDPTTVDIGENVRDDPETSQGYADLVASIGTHGVLVPCVAVRNSSGQITLRDGQRRILAAREAGLPTVPMYIIEDTATTDANREAGRITEQIVTNDQRAGLSEAQRAKGIQQLLTLGVSTAKVAKALTVPKKTVEAAAEVAASTAAMAVLSTGQLTIEQAALLGEFEDDPQALDYLLAAETTGQFDHRVSELRQSAASRAARAAAAAQYTKQGYTVLTQIPRWDDPLRTGRAERLYDADGSRLEDDPAARASAAPQLWAVYPEEIEIFTDTRTGERVEDSAVDWDARDDEEAEDGYIHRRHIAESVDYQPIFYCIDPAAAGLTTPEQRYSDTGRGRPAPSADDAETKERERREKRKVLALNKLGAAAQDVRRAYIKDKLLSRKTPPKGAAMFIAAHLAENPDLLGGYRVMATAAELLGIPENTPVRQTVSALAPGADGRATVMILGYILAALENNTDKTAWRGPGYRNLSTSYLQFLHTNGYELADIEKVVIGELAADTLFETLTAKPAADKAA